MTCSFETPIRGTAEFILERRYLKNVTPKTIAWYGHSFKAFAGALDSPESAKLRIIELRQRGVSPISVNTYLRCINAYWSWQGKDWKIPRLKDSTLGTTGGYIFNLSTKGLPMGSYNLNFTVTGDPFIYPAPFQVK